MDRSERLREVAGLFLRLGVTGFGGPAAHIALMHDEVVRRRGWLSEQEFLDMLGLTNLIPGPNSTEMAISIGYRRAGWAGLLLGGVCFILPAMLIVLALAWGYARYGQTPAVSALLYGVKPVVMALIVKALWELGRKALRGALLAGVGLAALGLNMLGVHELVLLLAAGLFCVLWMLAGRARRGGLKSVLPAGLPVWLAQAVQALAPLGLPEPFSLGVLFVTFLKIGAVLYGGGYVLLAFLRADFVERLGWLTDQQLIDAIAVGQVTPGPLFTTATFIGYQLGGWVGGVLATVGIFLPAFVFVAALHPFLPRLRESAIFGALLDGVNAGALGLMAAVTLQVGASALVDWPSWTLGLVSLLVLLRTHVNPTWLIAAGALLGWILMTVG